MTIVYDLLVVLHLLGWAIVLGGMLTAVRAPSIPRGVLHGILTALVTGLLLVGIASAGIADVHEPNNTKVGLKLLVALAVAALVVYGGRNPAKVTKGFVGAVIGLTVVNVSVAVLW